MAAADFPRLTGPTYVYPGRFSFLQNQSSGYFSFQLLCSLYRKIVPFCSSPVCDYQVITRRWAPYLHGVSDENGRAEGGFGGAGEGGGTVKGPGGFGRAGVDEL